MLNLTSLRHHYDTLYIESAHAATVNQLLPDAYLHNPAADTRRGLTLLVAVAPAVAIAAIDTLASLRQAAPELYYYPLPDLHVTLLTPLSGQPNQQLSAGQLQAYHSALQEAFEDKPAFDIDYEGLTLAPGAVLLQGYPAPAFQLLREHVRRELLAAGLPIAERYQSVSAHVTAVRFPVVPAAPASLVEYVRVRREVPLGRQLVTEILLVWNDWYNRQSRTQVVARYALKK